MELTHPNLYEVRDIYIANYGPEAFDKFVQDFRTLQWPGWTPLSKTLEDLASDERWLI